MKLLSEDEISERLATVSAWTRDGNNIVHVETLAGFSAAMLYVVAVGYLAEAADHHPDITIQWNKVTLTLSTHSAGGLTDKDFELAGRISQLG